MFETKVKFFVDLVMGRPHTIETKIRFTQVKPFSMAL